MFIYGSAYKCMCVCELLSVEEIQFRDIFKCVCADDASFPDRERAKKKEKKMVGKRKRMESVGECTSQNSQFFY